MIEILCGQCGKTLSVDDARMGQQFTCPHCAHPIMVPLLDELSEPPPPAAGQGAAEDEGFAANARQAMQKKIRAVCGSCGKGLSINPRHAGKTGRCPSCGGKIQIPALEDETIDFPVKGPLEGDIDDIELLDEVPKGADESHAASQASGHSRLPNPLVPVREDADEPVIAAAPSLPADQGEDIALPAVPQGPVADTPAPADAAAQTGANNVVAEATADSTTQAAGTDADADEPAPSATRTNWLIPVGAIAAACVAVAICLAVFLHGRHKNDDAVALVPGPGHPAKAGLVTPAATKPAPAHTPPALPAPKPSTASAPTLTTPDLPGTAACRIASASFSALAPGGLLPPAPDHLYCMVQAMISAGTAPLKLDLAKDVALFAGDQNIPCLGLPADDATGFHRAKQADIDIPADSQRSLTLVFDVPQSARAGVLKVRGLKNATAILGTPAAAPPASELAGTWAESSRASQPLPRDPVYASIQDVPPQEQQLVVVAEKDSLAVRLPAAGAKGSAWPSGAADGLFDAQLAGHGAILKCKLRLIQGPRLILYLADEPFNQMIFTKIAPPATQAASATPHG